MRYDTEERQLGSQRGKRERVRTTLKSTAKENMFGELELKEQCASIGLDQVNGSASDAAISVLPKRRTLRSKDRDIFLSVEVDEMSHNVVETQSSSDLSRLHDQYQSEGRNGRSEGKSRRCHALLRNPIHCASHSKIHASLGTPADIQRQEDSSKPPPLIEFVPDCSGICSNPQLPYCLSSRSSSSSLGLTQLHIDSLDSCYGGGNSSTELGPHIYFIDRSGDSDEGISLAEATPLHLLLESPAIKKSCDIARRLSYFLQSNHSRRPRTLLHCRQVDQFTKSPSRISFARLLSGAAVGFMITTSLFILLVSAIFVDTNSFGNFTEASYMIRDVNPSQQEWTQFLIKRPVATIGRVVAEFFPGCALPLAPPSIWFASNQTACNYDCKRTRKELQRLKRLQHYRAWRRRQCWFLRPLMDPISAWTASEQERSLLVERIWYENIFMQNFHELHSVTHSSNTTAYMRGFREVHDAQHRRLSWGIFSRKANDSSGNKGDSEDVSNFLDLTKEDTNFGTGPSKLVIAGQMIVDESECNIAQLDLTTNQIDKDERIQLSLYNSYSGGEVYSLLANQSYIGPKKVVQNTVIIPNIAGEPLLDMSSSSNSAIQADSPFAHYNPESALGTENGGLPPVAIDDSLPVYRYGRELIVVGAFDTTYRNSQVTYCSVGRWDGKMLNKVGEGLCNSALSKGMKITSAAFAGPNDVYVAGSFHTQVWSGDEREFVKIFNIAHYNAVNQVWLPLPVGQLTCSWCVVTVLALAWDNIRKQLHVAGKFNAIDNRNVPAGLALYDYDSGHLVAHPGGGLSLQNITEDGVGTALQMDQENGVLYVMGSYERLTTTKGICKGLAALEVDSNRWTCLADLKHTVEPTGGGNMLLTPYGLMVAGKVQGDQTTWPNPDKPYTIALLTINKLKKYGNVTGHEFEWSWLPGFDGHDDPIHCLSNGYGDHEGTVFIGGDNFVAKWHYKEMAVPFADPADANNTASSEDFSPNIATRTAASTQNPNTSKKKMVMQKLPVTETLSSAVRGSVMAISQLVPVVEHPKDEAEEPEVGPYVSPTAIGYTVLVYSLALGTVLGMLLAILCNKNMDILGRFFSKDSQVKGISLDTLTYSAVENSTVAEACQRAMRNRFVDNPNLLTIINPAEIVVHRIIGEGTFGRVWSASWRSADVAVKEFVFAQAAVAGRSSMQKDIIDDIIGEAGMMAMLRHPNVLQMFGCCLTSQAIWIVSELCSLGSLRQLLDDQDRVCSNTLRLSLALQIAEGMTYLHNQETPIIHRDLKSHNIFVHETTTVNSNQKTKHAESRNRIGNSGLRKTVARVPISSKDSIRSNISENIVEEKIVAESIIVAKIGDWGTARAESAGSRTMTHGVGTACWLAPEVIKHNRCSTSSDVFSFGIILWELATREEVYQGLETMQIIAKVANERLRPPVPHNCLWKDLMCQCWEENPAYRPSFETISKELNVLLARDRLSSISSSESLPESYQNGGR